MVKKLAVITGASSGIGRSFAKKFASLGYDLILIARNKERLSALAKDVKGSYNSSAEILSHDLSDENQIKYIEKILTQKDNIDVLVNSAGFGLNEKFYKTPIEKSMAMIRVHIIAIVRLTRAVLPIMIKNDSGTIINVSSMGAFIMFPNNLIYSATKTFINTFSEHLKLELEDTNIIVQAICPSYTRTNFYNTPEFKGLDLSAVPERLWYTPDKLVEISLNSLSKKKVICIPGIINKLAVIFRKGLSRRVIKKLSKSQRSAATGGSPPFSPR